ncbi:substrate-binding domain-containing protein [Anaerosacchariphilus polymeriproducens]|uniref:Sugar ABC transporter substrate-binding protein n=1 Tax=Anaerosacchariphilus polymeriproducens TaxID=1812858 RepID=A0A371AVH5_9FIRM|nr:substrate-binding domain-containing protein [Anaerosacchariphilus polymeriproducens]RDU23567.1 sugar ABC transporter substrate-binding protein [Anaerosacchariphilus polymeriproducens]
MNKKQIWICIIWFNVIMIICGINFFLLDKDFSAGQIEDNLKIGACYTNMKNSYFEVLNNEISSVIEEHGDILITRDASMDPDKQNEQIMKLIELGVKGIFVTPVNWKKIEPVLKSAREKGVIIVAVDSSVFHEELVDCSVTSDNYGAGKQVANYIMSQVKEAKIVLIKQESLQSSQERIKGFKDGIVNMKEYQIMEEKECSGQVKNAMKSIQEVFNKGIQFDYVFAINDPFAIGAIAILEKLGVESNIKVIGMDGSPAGKSMVKKEKMLATAAQYPTEIGSKAVESMYHLLMGQKCEKKILVPVKLITNCTIDSYNTYKWQ